MLRTDLRQSWLAEVRALVLLAAPLIFAQLAMISMWAVDTIMAGRLGPTDLAAVALGGSMWVPPYIFAMGLVAALSPTVAQLFGAEKLPEIGGQVRQGLWLALFGAIPVSLYLWNAEPVLAWMHAPVEVRPIAAGYLKAMACGVPASLCYSALRSHCEAVSDTVPILIVSLIVLPCNILGNTVFMYGYLGAPALGAVGTGVASAINMWLMFGLLATWVAKSQRHRAFECFGRFEPPRRADLLTLARLGLPIGTSMFLECSLFSIVSLWMGSLGAVVIAGHQVAMNFASITFMVPLGIAMAITVRVGQALGREDVRAARRAGAVGIGLSVGVMGVAALGMFLFPRQIASVYSADPKVQAMAVVLLGMAAIFQISDGLQVAGSGALRGLKDTSVPMLITLTAYWGIGLPLAVGLGFTAGLGPQGAWIGLIAGLTVAAVLLNVRFYWKTRTLLRAEDNAPAVVESEPMQACGQM